MLDNEEDANPLAAVFRVSDEIADLLDDPDSAGQPVDFLVKLENLSNELADNAKRVTPADFETEYAEDEDDEDEDAIDAEVVS